MWLIVINQYQDPYETTRFIGKVRPFFFSWLIYVFVRRAMNMMGAHEGGMMAIDGIDNFPVSETGRLL